MKRIEDGKRVSFRKVSEINLQASHHVGHTLMARHTCACADCLVFPKATSPLVAILLEESSPALRKQSNVESSELLVRDQFHIASAFDTYIDSASDLTPFITAWTFIFLSIFL